jgi:hypothetical protein
VQGSISSSVSVEGNAVAACYAFNSSAFDFSILETISRRPFADRRRDAVANEVAGLVRRHQGRLCHIA